MSRWCMGLLVVGLTACSSAPSLTVVADDPALLSGPSAEQLRVLWINHLLVRLTTPRLAPGGVTWVRLQLVSPAGTLFEDRRLPFGTEAAIEDIRAPKPVAAGYALDSAIVVGGTELQLRPQAGRWKISARLEALDLSAERGVTFEVAP